MHAADEDDDEEDAPAQKKPAKAKPAKVQTAGWAQAWRMQAPVHFCPLSRSQVPCCLPPVPPCIAGSSVQRRQAARLKADVKAHTHSRTCACCILLVLFFVFKPTGGPASGPEVRRRARERLRTRNGRP